MVTAVAVAAETVDKSVIVATEAGMGELEVMVERVVTQEQQVRWRRCPSRAPLRCCPFPAWTLLQAPRLESVPLSGKGPSHSGGEPCWRCCHRVSR